MNFAKQCSNLNVPELPAVFCIWMKLQKVTKAVVLSQLMSHGVLTTVLEKLF